MIRIVHCGIGNLQSVLNAFEAIEVPVKVASNPAELADATRIVLPGVGSFRKASAALTEGGWRDAMAEKVLHRRLPFLGICLGMQMIAEWGDEHGGSEGLGWIPGKVVQIPRAPALRLPHVGWNELRIERDHPLFAGLGTERNVYFVHSFHFVATEPGDCLATTDYGVPVTAAVARENVYGCQFHPEKSQQVGLSILKNFARC